MASYNRSTIIGNIGGEIKPYGEGEKMLVNFSVATSRGKDKKTGKDRTTWHQCVAFRKTAELLLQHAGKGDQIHVEGAYESQDYTDKTGTVVRTMKLIVDCVTFLNGKRKAPEREPAPRPLEVEAPPF